MTQRRDYFQNDQPELYHWLMHADHYWGKHRHRSHQSVGERTVANYRRELHGDLITGDWHPKDERLKAMQDRYAAFSSRLQLLRELVCMAEAKTDEDVIRVLHPPKKLHALHMRDTHGAEASLAEDKLPQVERYQRLMDALDPIDKAHHHARMAIQGIVAIRELNELLVRGVDIDSYYIVGNFTQNPSLKEDQTFQATRNALLFPHIRRRRFNDSYNSLIEVRINAKKLGEFLKTYDAERPNDQRHEMEKQAHAYCVETLIPEIIALAGQLSGDIKTVRHWIGRNELHHTPPDRTVVPVSFHARPTKQVHMQGAELLHFEVQKSIHQLLTRA